MIALMRIIAIAGFGAALIGIGVAVPGLLSTALILVGLGFVVASPFVLLLPDRGTGNSIQIGTNSEAPVTNPRAAMSSGAGSIDQSNHVETHNYYGQARHKADPALVFRAPEQIASTLKAPPQFPGSVGVFVVFQVANDPPPGVVCEPATHVRATIAIYDDEGCLLVPEIAARWQNKPQPIEVGPFKPVGAPELSEETLQPNGASHGIDSVVWLRNEDEVFIWNQQGIGQKIKISTFNIEVRVRGTNVNEIRSYRLTKSNSPVDGFSITELGRIQSSSLQQPKPEQPKPGATQNPWSQAALLQRRYERKQLRQHLRIIGEDELQLLNRPRLVALLETRETSMSIATAQWSKHHEHLREADDPAPYRDAAAAYRGLIDLSERLQLERRADPLTPDDLRAVEQVLRSVDQAVSTLRHAES